MITCRRCSSVLPEHARFCGYCGCMVREQERVLTALLDSNRTALLEHPPGKLEDVQTLWEPISDADLSIVALSEESLPSRDTPPPDLNFLARVDEVDEQAKTLPLEDTPTIPGLPEGESLTVPYDQEIFALHSAPSTDEEETY